MSNEGKEVLERAGKELEKLRALQEAQRKLLKRIVRVGRVGLFSVLLCSLGAGFCVRAYWIYGMGWNGAINLAGLSINAFCIYINARSLWDLVKRFAEGWVVSKQIGYTILEAEKFRAFVIENEKLKDSQ